MDHEFVFRVGPIGLSGKETSDLEDGTLPRNVTTTPGPTGQVLDLNDQDDVRRLRRGTAGINEEKGEGDAPSPDDGRGRRPAPRPPEPDAPKLKIVELIEVDTLSGKGEGVIQGARPRDQSKARQFGGNRAHEPDYEDVDGNVFRQYINLNRYDRGDNKRHPDYSRYIEFRARIDWESENGGSLRGKKVKWSFTEDPYRRIPASEPEDPDRRAPAMELYRHYKGLSPVMYASRPGTPDSPSQPPPTRPLQLQGDQKAGFSTTRNTYNRPGSAVVPTIENFTDDEGWTSFVTFRTSEFAGDRYTVHAEISPSEISRSGNEPAQLDAGPFVVSRKAWIYVAETPTNRWTSDVSDNVKYVLNETAHIVLDAVKITKVTPSFFGKKRKYFYYPIWMLPDWMISYIRENSGRKFSIDREAFVVRSETFKNPKVLKKSDIRRLYPKGKKTHPSYFVVLATAAAPWTESTGRVTLPVFRRTAKYTFSDLKYTRAFLKPLPENLVRSGKWRIDTNPSSPHSAAFAEKNIPLIFSKAPKKTEGLITDRNILIKKNRGNPHEILIKLPRDCPSPKRYRVVLEIELNVVRFSRGYVSDGMNVICQLKDTNDLSGTINHELGHAFGQSAKSAPGLPPNPTRYTGMGGVGPHCSYQGIRGTSTDNPPKPIWRDGECVMFGRGGGNIRTIHFCEYCETYLRLADIGSIPNWDGT